jgi:hypothetical protein
VVIWPRAKQFHVLCAAGTDAAVGGLDAMVRQLKRASKTKRQGKRLDCLSFAQAIIDTWQPGHGSYDRETRDVDHNTFPASLCELNEPDPALRVKPTSGICRIWRACGRWKRELVG